MKEKIIKRSEGGFVADWIALLDDASNEVRAAHPDYDNRVAGRAMEMAGVKVSLDSVSGILGAPAEKPAPTTPTDSSAS